MNGKSWVLIVALVVAAAGCATPEEDVGTEPSPTPATAAEPAATGPADAVAELDRCSDVQLAQQAWPQSTDGQDPPSPLPTPDVQVRHDEIQALDTWAQETLGEEYGGLFLDVDTIVVLTTGDPEAIEPELDEETDLPYRVEQVANSAAELEDARQTLQSLPMGEEPVADGGIVSAVGTMVLANRVFVSIIGDPAPVAEQITELVDPGLVCLELEETPDVGDAEPAAWQVDPAWQPDPAATEVPILLSERACHGDADPEGRIVVRDIAYEEDRVVADLGVIPLSGPQTCPGTPPFPTTLHLEEPLDDRDLLPAPGQDLEVDITPAPPATSSPVPQPTPMPSPSPTPS